jgi:SAM-dependent methyltransferase
VLNWIARYAPALDALSDAPLGSVLDVGCGPHGLSCVAPEVPFVGVDVEFPVPVVPTMTALRTAGGPLPFADRAFDSVVSLDTLEHVPAHERGPFVQELARVTAGTLVVGCPIVEAAEVDEAIRQMYVQMGAPVPDWVDEHEEFGLPTATEVEGWARGVEGFEARYVPNTNGMLTALAAFADLHPALAERAATEVRERSPEWAQLFLGGTFGPGLRAMWLLRRTTPAPGLVRGDDLQGTLGPATRCPRCGAPLDAALVCTNGDFAAQRDPATGAIALVR